jgi:hypothetical protein
MTNEERFLASCVNVGEAAVRQKLSNDRYAGRRASWAQEWLNQIDNGKSEATKAEERSLLDPKPRARRGLLRVTLCGFATVLLFAAYFLYSQVT